jgi:hypothetical protein
MRTGDRSAIAGYLGGGDTADIAFTRFAETYADRNEHDYAALVRASQTVDCRLNETCELLSPFQYRQLIVKPRTDITDFVADGLTAQPQAVDDLLCHMTGMIGRSFGATTTSDVAVIVDAVLLENLADALDEVSHFRLPPRGGSLHRDAASFE